MNAQPVEHGGSSLWAPDPVGQRFGSHTVDDILALPDHAPRVELRDGLMIETPTPNAGHEEIIALLLAWLRAHAPSDFWASRSTGIVDSETDTYEPDVVLLRSEGLVTDARFVRCDQVVLVVEVVSRGTTTRDRYSKPALYADSGIAYLWRVEQDPVRVFAYDLVSGPTYRLVARSDVEISGNVLVLSAPFDIRMPIADITP